MEQMLFPIESPSTKPLVATFAITPSVQSYFNELRRKHFPAERNYLDAHLTLFHALPDKPWIFADFQELSENQQPLDVTVQSIMSLGGGTAFKIVSSGLSLLHQQLQKRWFEHITNQDRQKRNFHITVQNKVEPAEAKKLQADLMTDFLPFSFTVTGIQLWRYHNGPWEYLRKFDFE
jgi:hypothetical protein